MWFWFGGRMLALMAVGEVWVGSGGVWRGRRGSY